MLSAVVGQPLPAGIGFLGYLADGGGLCSALLLLDKAGLAFTYQQGISRLVVPADQRVDGVHDGVTVHHVSDLVQLALLLWPPPAALPPPPADSPPPSPRHEDHDGDDGDGGGGGAAGGGSSSRPAGPSYHQPSDEDGQQQQRKSGSEGEIGQGDAGVSSGSSSRWAVADGLMQLMTSLGRTRSSSARHDLMTAATSSSSTGDGRAENEDETVDQAAAEDDDDEVVCVGVFGREESPPAGKGGAEVHQPAGAQQQAAASTTTEGCEGKKRAGAAAECDGQEDEEEKQRQAASRERIMADLALARRVATQILAQEGLAHLTITDDYNRRIADPVQLFGLIRQRLETRQVRAGPRPNTPYWR